MRKMMMLPVLVFQIAWLAPGSAEATTFYRYQTERSVAFTDKLENVPERYRESAVPVLAEDLSSYEKTTIAEDHPPTPRPGRLDAIDAEQAAPRTAVRAPAPAPFVVYDTTGVTIMADGNDPDGQGPIRVERNVYRWEEGSLYQYTVIRRGERVLAEIREGNGIF